jgi:glycosyltransferase involved in cell wall biosynthesis
LKVLLIGSYPPPLGGVSVFLQRYKKKLEREGHSVDVLDPTKTANLAILIELLKARAKSYDIVSLNYPSIPLLRTLHTLGLTAKTEFWDHNWRVFASWSEKDKRFFGDFLQSCRALNLVSDELRAEYELHNLALPKATRVQDPFIPPAEEDEQLIFATYPDQIKSFVEEKRPLIVANAFRLMREKGIDLYGLDMCVDLIETIQPDYPNLGFLFALAEIGDQEYFDRLAARISDSRLESNFCFLTGQKEFWPLLKRASLMVRPTSTDGYALSVAEAIYFNCAVVASDAAKRPRGCVIFKNRDRDDFIKKCRTELLNK